MQQQLALKNVSINDTIFGQVDLHFMRVRILALKPWADNAIKNDAMDSNNPLNN